MPSKTKTTKNRQKSKSNLPGFVRRRRFSLTVAAIIAVSAVVLGMQAVHSTFAATATAGTPGLLAASFSNSSGTPMCLDVYQNQSVNGAPVNIFTCNRNDAAQIWTPYSDGTIRIHGRCLDVKGQSTADGAAIELYDCNGGANQNWTRGTNLHVSLNNLVSAQSGKCLDDANYGSTNNNKTQLWTCNGGTAQVWGWVTSADPLQPGGKTAYANCHGVEPTNKDTCFNWVTAYQANNSNFSASGVQVDMSQPNPAIGKQWPGDGGLYNHSVAEYWAQSADGKAVVEFGWYKDVTRAKPILFATYWYGDTQFGGYVQNGGTGFVPVSTTLHIGDPVPATASGTYKVQLVGTQWQFWYNGTEIGYFPQSTWTSKGYSFNSIGWVAVYGEVTGGAYTVNHTQMGNGQFGSSGSGATFKNYKLINSTTPATLERPVGPGSPGNAGWNFGFESATGFAYGGPGL